MNAAYKFMKLAEFLAKAIAPCTSKYLEILITINWLKVLLLSFHEGLVGAPTIIELKFLGMFMSKITFIPSNII